jgi:hypothetical protein
MDDSTRRLEQAVVFAWPASETADVDGWLLRASGGPTNRGNSHSLYQGVGFEHRYDYHSRVRQA